MPDKLRAIEQLVKRDGLVVGPEDFSAAFSRYREEGAERASEVAELLVLPVKEALENLDRQRFAGSEDGAECRTDFLAKLLQVRELPLEELAEMPPSPWETGPDGQARGAFARDRDSRARRRETPLRPFRGSA